MLEDDGNTEDPLTAVVSGRQCFLEGREVLSGEAMARWAGQGCQGTNIHVLGSAQYLSAGLVQDRLQPGTEPFPGL